MIQVVDLTEGAPARLDPETPLEPPAPGTLRWIDVEVPTAGLMAQLQGPFRLHPLAVEDCLTFDQRPKLEEYPGHVFVVIHELSLKEGDIVGHEIHAFLGANFLITVHESSCRRIGDVARRLAIDSEVFNRGIAFVYYLIADAVATYNAETLDALAESIDLVEDEVFEASGDAALTRVFRMKRALAAARRAVSPQRDLFAALSRVGSKWVSDRTALYLRDVYDRLARSSETLESSRELLSNVLDAHFSMVSQRTNDVVKHLTILSAVFMPLTFVTGFFGQNFTHLPFDSKSFMAAAIGCCVAIPVGMLYFFRRRHWL